MTRDPVDKKRRRRDGSAELSRSLATRVALLGRLAHDPRLAVRLLEREDGRELRPRGTLGLAPTATGPIGAG
jgi:hypothetical protein